MAKKQSNSNEETLNFNSAQHTENMENIFKQKKYEISYLLLQRKVNILKWFSDSDKKVQNAKKNLRMRRRH